MLTDPDLAIATIARTQMGAFSRRDATRSGMTDRMIRARVNRGHWRQLEQDVFALSCFPSTWDQRCLAAT